MEDLNSRYKSKGRNSSLIDFHVRFRETYKTVLPQKMTLSTEVNGITLPNLASWVFSAIISPFQSTAKVGRIFHIFL